MGGGASVNGEIKYKAFSYKNWSTFTIDMAEVPIRINELEKDLLNRSDLISPCLFCKENDIKVIAKGKDFMCNFCIVQKGIDDKDDIFKKIVELNELHKEVMNTTLEWKIFMEFWTAVLDEELSSEGMDLIDKIFKDAHLAAKNVNKVKVNNDAAALINSIQVLKEWKEKLEDSLILK